MVLRFLLVFYVDFLELQFVVVVFEQGKIIILKFVFILILLFVRNYLDGELFIFVLVKDIFIWLLYFVGKVKVVFMFLIGGFLLFEKLWEKFFEVSVCL